MTGINKDEKEILKAYEDGKLRSTGKTSAKMRKYKTYADATFRKDKRINIRISSKDLEGLQKQAVEEGLPYQTFIASILHKYIAGRFKKKKQHA